MKDGIYFLATVENEALLIEKFKNIVADYFNDEFLRSLPLNSFEQIFQYIAKQNKKLVVVIDEFQYLARVNAAISSIFQKIIDEYLKDKNIIKYDEKYIHAWPLHPYQYLVEIIKQRKWERSNIGLEMDSHYFTALCYETIKTGLPNAKIKDAERLVNWVRIVKSDAEIKLMKSAARITESAMKIAFKSINPGVRQCDAVADIQKALFNGTPEFGGDYAGVATLLPTGKGTSASHLTATEDKFVLGEATIIEIAGVYKRYHCPMARTVLLGQKNQKKNRYNESNKRGSRCRNRSY